MSLDSTSEALLPGEDLKPWQPPPPPSNLIFDDGEPLETHRHRLAMNLLIDSVEVTLSHREDYFVGGNMFVYYSRDQAMNRDFRGPDCFVVLGVPGDRERRGWVVWEEEGRYPNIIVELMSPSTARVDLTQKKDLYEGTFRTPEYFVYDPFKPESLRGWRLNSDNGYQELEPNENGWLWCSQLQHWLGLWSGRIHRERAVWLRFYTPQGELVQLPREVERQRAEAERQRAEVERQRAEAERQRAERLAAKLRELGVNPEEL